LIPNWENPGLEPGGDWPEPGLNRDGIVWERVHIGGEKLAGPGWLRLGRILGLDALPEMNAGRRSRLPRGFLIFCF